MPAFHYLILLTALLTISMPVVAENNAAPACDFSAMDHQQTMSLHNYQGKVVYLDFWASWCGPCLESFPFMNQLHTDLHSQGLEVVAVNLDEDLADGQSFLAQHPPKFTVVADADQQCARQLALKAMPSTYLIDRKGIIRATHLGFRAGEAAEFRKTVEAVLQEAP